MMYGPAVYSVDTFSRSGPGLTPEGCGGHGSEPMASTSQRKAQHAGVACRGGVKYTFLARQRVRLPGT